jgi:hypothetical protein
MALRNGLYAPAIWATTTAPLAGCATRYHRGNGLRIKVEENGRRVAAASSATSSSTRGR